MSICSFEFYMATLIRSLVLIYAQIPGTQSRVLLSCRCGVNWRSTIGGRKLQKHHVLAIAVFTYMTVFTLAEKNPDIILASPKNESLKKVKIGGFKRTHDFLA